MKIDYNVYYKNNFIIPLIAVIALIAFIVVDAVFLLKKINTKSMFYYAFSIVVSIVIIGYIFSSLVRGFHLISEKEQDVLITGGEITDITFVYNSPRYYIDHKACRAIWVHIGNQKYYTIDTDDISIGDDIIIHYLPQSRFVLEYSKGELG